MAVAVSRSKPPCLTVSALASLLGCLSQEEWLPLSLRKNIPSRKSRLVRYCRLTVDQRKREREGGSEELGSLEEHKQNLTAGEGEISGVNLEDKDEKQCALAYHLHVVCAKRKSHN